MLKTVATRLKYQNVVRFCFSKCVTAQPVLRISFTTCGCYVIARASEASSLQQTGESRGPDGWENAARAGSCKVQHWALRPNYDIYSSGMCCSHSGFQHVTARSTAFSSALYNTISGAENNQSILKTKHLYKVSMTQLNLDRKLEDSQHAGDCSAWPKAAAGPE